MLVLGAQLTEPVPERGRISVPFSERLDLRNGLAACPDHDVAFDTGLLTVGVGLEIHYSEALANAVRGDPLARQYYGRPPLLERLLLPDAAQSPARKYLDWHKTKGFIA